MLFANDFCKHFETRIYLEILILTGTYYRYMYRYSVTTFQAADAFDIFLQKLQVFSGEPWPSGRALDTNGEVLGSVPILGAMLYP